jgi:hypothetical protein
MRRRDEQTKEAEQKKQTKEEANKRNEQRTFDRRALHFRPHVAEQTRHADEQRRRLDPPPRLIAEPPSEERKKDDVQRALANVPRPAL